MKIVLLLLLLSFSLATQADTILFLGDSLSEGYGVPKEKAFPSLIQKKLTKKYANKWSVVNGSVSGSTTASASSRLRWFKKLKPKILVLALGANDGLRGIKVNESKKNLAATIDSARRMGMKVLLVGMMMPPNYGPDYTREFKSIFTDLAEEKKVALVPFLLEGVAGEKELNQADGIHPNQAGHEKMAETVYLHLEKML